MARPSPKRFATPAAQHQADREVTGFRQYQEMSRVQLCEETSRECRLRTKSYPSTDSGQQLGLANSKLVNFRFNSCSSRKPLSECSSRSPTTKFNRSFRQ